MKRLLAVSLFAATLVAAPAASAQTAPSARQLQLAEQLMTAMKLEQQMQQMSAQMQPVMVEQFKRAAPNLPPEKAQLLAQIFAEAMPGLIRQMKGKMGPIYAETFSEQELTDALAFYATPSGQAFLGKSPTVAAKMMPMMGELMPGVMKDVMTRFCSKTDCSTLPKPPPRT